MDSSHRPTTRLLERFDHLLGRRRELAMTVAGLGVLVVVALALMARGAPAQIAPPATEPPVGLPSAIQAVVSPASAEVVVHVAGAVRAPGVYSLPAGARVTDAIAAAGGARPKADLDALNLAAVLSDGEKIEVPRKGSAVAAGTSGDPSPDAGASPLVSINNADESALDSIPGIGPVTAEAILKYRAEIGSFESIDQLIDVPGIGPATLESIRPYVTL